MGLRKSLRSLDKTHRGHRKMGLALATGDTKKFKDGVKQAHAGHKDHLRNAHTTAMQDGRSFINRHPELRLDPGLNAIAGRRDEGAPLDPGLAFLQQLFAANQRAMIAGTQA